MIEHVYRRASAARGVDRVVVATDDERIATTVERFGGVARLTRKTHRTGTDRVAEAAAGLPCEIVVNVQGDEPLIEPRMIEEALLPFQEDPLVAMATLRRAIADERDYTNPNVVKVVVDRRGDALYFSRAAIPFSRPAADATRAYKHVGLYAYRREFLLTLAGLAPTPLEVAESLEQLRVLEHGFRIRTIETQFESVGVDTPEDLERARALLSAPARA
jgi:3-deoxy-manno-octulosonate cytidylyltransferase (CMP-KDO synthetase)